VDVTYGTAIGQTSKQKEEGALLTENPVWVPTAVAKADESRLNERQRHKYGDAELVRSKKQHLLHGFAPGRAGQWGI